MKRRARTVVHVNQHIIRRNARLGETNPPITVRQGKQIERCSEVTIYGQDGLPAAKVIYSPLKPLACGARVWIDVEGAIEIICASEPGSN